MLLRENDILGDRFRLETLIGEGGMGMVWCAWDSRANERVALKFLRGFGGEMARKRFFREARASMAVQHPNVCQVREVLTAPDGSPLMVMEFLEGESLGAKLQREGKLPIPIFAKVFLPVLAAIGSAHEKGIVHRDLKPDNIFVCKDGTVRVLDFGIAKLTATDGEAMATAGLTSTGAMLGTPYYMSPEQVFSDKTIDHRADVWSLGVILYECLSGRKPIQADSMGMLLRAVSTGELVPLREIDPDLPPELLDLCQRMLTLKREERPADLREVYAIVSGFAPIPTKTPFGEATMDAAIAFEETIASDPLSLVSTNDGVTSTHVTRGRRRPAWLVVPAVVALGGIATGAYLRFREQPVTTTTPPPPPSAQSTQTAVENSAMPIASLVPAIATSATASASASHKTQAAVTPKPSASVSAGTTIAPSASASGHPMGIASVNPYQ